MWDTLFHILSVPDHDFLFLLNRQLWFCGEVVTTCLLDRSVKMFPWMRFVNLYSISEAHDVAGSDLSEYYKSQVRQTWTQSMKLVPLPKSQIDQPGNCICILLIAHTLVIWFPSKITVFILTVFILKKFECVFIFFGDCAFDHQTRFYWCSHYIWLTHC